MRKIYNKINRNILVNDRWKTTAVDDKNMAV